MRYLLGVLGLSLGIVACHPRTQLHPRFDAKVVELFGAGRQLHCEVHRTHATLGPLRGCLATRGDTIVYLWTDEAGEVVSFGRRWRVPADRSRTTFDSLARVLDSSETVQAVSCADAPSGPLRADRRWPGTETHKALLLVRLPRDLFEVQMVTQRGAPACSERYPVPMTR